MGVLFGFGGTSKTRGQLAKEELGIGFDHFLQAAQHAAGGAGAAVGPRAHAVRSMITPAAGRVRTAASSGWDSTMDAFAPLMMAAREGAHEATETALKIRAKEARRREKEEQVKQRRIGLAVGLLAAGAAVGAAAALMMRRRRRMAWDEYDPSEALESMMDSATEKASEMSDKAADAMKSAGDKTADTLKTAGDKAGDMGQKASDATRKTGDKVSGSGQDSMEEAGAYASDRADSVNSKLRRS